MILNKNPNKAKWIDKKSNIFLVFLYVVTLCNMPGQKRKLNNTLHPPSACLFTPLSFSIFSFLHGDFPSHIYLYIMRIFFVVDRCHFCSRRCPHEAAVENMQSSFMLARDKFPSTIFLPFPFLSLYNVLLNCSKFHFIGWSPIRVRKVLGSYYAAGEIQKIFASLLTYK